MNAVNNSIVATRAALAVTKAKAKAMADAHPVAVENTKNVLIVTGVAWSIGSLLGATYQAAAELLA